MACAGRTDGRLAQPIRRGNGLQNVEGVYLPDTSPDAETNFFRPRSVIDSQRIARGATRKCSSGLCQRVEIY